MDFVTIKTVTDLYYFEVIILNSSRSQYIYIKLLLLSQFIYLF